jgi:hypothetical protein
MIFVTHNGDASPQSQKLLQLFIKIKCNINSFEKVFIHQIGVGKIVDINICVFYISFRCGEYEVCK